MAFHPNQIGIYTPGSILLVSRFLIDKLMNAALSILLFPVIPLTPFKGGFFVALIYL